MAKKGRTETGPHNRTLYVKQEDQETWIMAEEIAGVVDGVSMSAAVMVLLKEYVDERKHALAAVYKARSIRKVKH